MMEDHPDQVDWDGALKDMKDANARLEDDLMAVEMRLVENLMTLMEKFNKQIHEINS